jgi:hypothetical protein
MEQGAASGVCSRVPSLGHNLDRCCLQTRSSIVMVGAPFLWPREDAAGVESVWLRGANNTVEWVAENSAVEAANIPPRSHGTLTCCGDRSSYGPYLSHGTASLKAQVLSGSTSNDESFRKDPPPVGHAGKRTRAVANDRRHSRHARQAGIARNGRHELNDVEFPSRARQRYSKILAAYRIDSVFHDIDQ